MNLDRRNFVRVGLTVLGAAVAGECGRRVARAAGTEPAAATTCCSLSDQPSANASAGGAGVALTPGHRLIDPATGQPLPVKEASVRQGIPGRRWIMVIDLARCDGCGTCTRACGKMHYIPADRQWIKVLRMQASEKTAPYFFPQPCYHCDNPPCTKVCPVDATFKREDGVVLIDNVRCIGCRFCMAACPYSARSFNWGRPHDPPQAMEEPYSPEHGFPRRMGTVEKCDFCPDMAAEGMLPACVSACPMGAIYYGDENEDAVTNAQKETCRLSQLLMQRSGYRHLEELGTKPRVYYLPPSNRMHAPPAASPSHTQD